MIYFFLSFFHFFSIIFNLTEIIRHDLSKYTVPTSFVGIAVPTKVAGIWVLTKVVGMLLVLALPTKVMGMQARNQIQESKGSDFH